MVNLLAGIGLLAVLGLVALALLAWALLMSEPGRMVVKRMLDRHAPASPPRPAPDDLKPRPRG